MIFFLLFPYLNQEPSWLNRSLRRLSIYTPFTKCLTLKIFLSLFYNKNSPFLQTKYQGVSNENEIDESFTKQ